MNQHNKYYEPGEDSYILFDVLKTENIQNKIILDLGSSTGVLGGAFDSSNIVISSDINFFSLLNNSNYDKISTDLLNGIIQTKFDIIIFNPPYVPLSMEMVVLDNNDKNLQLDNDYEQIGGKNKNGNKVILDFINAIEFNGEIYLLIIAANDYGMILDVLQDKNFQVEVKKIKKVMKETIIILRVFKLYYSLP